MALVGRCARCSKIYQIVLPKTKTQVPLLRKHKDNFDRPCITWYFKTLGEANRYGK